AGDAIGPEVGAAGRRRDRARGPFFSESSSVTGVMRMAPPLARVVSRTVARTKPLVPDGVWPLLLTLRSIGGEGPAVGLPAFGRVLVLAAHPDDESLGCAGTIAQLADLGAEVTIVFATDGDATRGSSMGREATGRLRRREAEAACQVLGVGRPRFLGYPDGGLPGMVDDLAQAIAALVGEVGPEVALLPWFLDGHRDHRALSTALALAAAGASWTGRPELMVWGYETWTPLPANRLVDITPVVERKRRALAAHATAHLAFDVSASLGLSRWRSIHGLMGRGHAEAFLEAPVGEYLDLMHRLDVVGREPPAPRRPGGAR
ncbi:MAG: PIG-L deacetylase family protein, partial [Acidimicrobiales bacterium]